MSTCPFEAQAVAQGHAAVTFRYLAGFAEADPGYRLLICGREVGYGDTPKEALQGLVDELVELRQWQKEVRQMVAETILPKPVGTLHRSQCGYPASP